MSARFTMGGVLLGLFALAIPASAQSSALVLDVKNGLVTLDARDVPVAQILTRWAQIAGVTVVNGDKLASIRVTMRLDAVSQREALALLLRDAGGYIAASRPSASGRGTEIDRILIVPRSTPAAPTPSTQRAASGRAARASENAGSGSAQTTAALDSTISPDSDADTSADDVQAAERNQESDPDVRQPTRPSPTFGGGTSQPLVNGLTLDEIRARAVRTSADPVPPPPDPGRYAQRQAEEAQRAQQALREQQAAAQTGPFGARGTTAQPGAVAPQPRTGPNAPAPPPTAPQP